MEDSTVGPAPASTATFARYRQQPDCVDFYGNIVHSFMNGREHAVGCIGRVIGAS